MPVRSFDNDDSEIRVPIVSATKLVDTFTVAMLIAPGTNTDPFGTPYITGYDSAGTAQWVFGLKSGVPYFKSTNGSQTDNAPGTMVAAEDTWQIVTYSRTGTAGARIFSLFELGGSWSHEFGDFGGNASSLTDTAGGFIGFGYPGGSGLDAHWALAGIWKDGLDNTEVEALATGLASQDWVDHSSPPGGAWNFNQATVTDVPDLMGNHATVTGTIDSGTDTKGTTDTSVVFDDDPPSWDFTTAPPALRVTFRYSGGAANDDPLLSIGGAESSEGGQEATGLDGVLLNVVPSFDRLDAIAGKTVYRGVYVHLEDNGFATPADLAVWLDTLDLASGVAVAIGAAPEGSGGTMQAIANETTAPSGVSFSAPTTEGGAISLGEVASDEGAGVWIRTTLTAHGAGGLGNNFSLSVSVTPA